MKVLAILPCWNEENKIGPAVIKTKSYVNQVLVVDDYSSDNTVKEASSCGAVVLSHKKNLGVGAALKSGFEYAIKKKFDIVIIMAGDNQDNPAEIPIFLKAMKEGYDLIQGSRYLKKFDHKQPFSRKITTRLFTLFFRLVVGYPITDASNGFKAIRISLIKDLNLLKNDFDRYELEPYIIIQAIRNNYKFKEVPVTKHYDLIHGYSKMKPFISWFQICKPIIISLFKKNE